MPQRKSTHRYDATEVQGEGAYVVVRTTSYGQQKNFVRNSESMTDYEKQLAIEAMIVENVIEWNWVNDDGEPLPLPKNDPGIMEELTANEVVFLGEAIAGQADLKN